MRKRAYRATAIKNLNLAEFLLRLAAGPVQVGVDVAKNELLVTLHDSSGAFQRPWKVKQPTEIFERAKEVPSVRIRPNDPQARCPTLAAYGLVVSLPSSFLSFTFQTYRSPVKSPAMTRSPS